ncbi:MAG: tyrosine--tRNA ligase [Candidatus Dojkabacteria bacterium]
MAKIVTDQEKVSQFLERGVEQILPQRGELEKLLLSGQRIHAYMGFDPTGPHLHVGHAMGIRALRILQELGHKVTFLVGDYTARVGDPDKDTTRDLLTTEQIEQNMKGWKEQAAQLINFEDKSNPVEFAHNFDWLSKLNLEELIGLMSKMTVQQMLERDLFAKRMDEQKPIQLQELIYPLMQGYDSVVMDVDLELGGTDQTFNMMVGRNLVRHYLGKDKHVRTHRMMPAPEGLTMSKTKGNGINLSDTAENMYGVAMSYPDEHILTGLELLTDTPMEEIEQISAELENGQNPMQFKKLMAFRIVEVIKGTSEAQNAQKHFEQTIQGGEVSEQRIKMSKAIVEKSLGEQIAASVLVKEFLKSSKGDAKRLIQQGGVEVDGNKILDANEPVEVREGALWRMGKRNWFEIVE